MNFPLQITKRPRRNRKSGAIRSLIQENHLLPSDFISPFFVAEGQNIRNPICSLPGQFHLSLDNLHKEMDEHLSLGVTSFMLFALVLPKHKDPYGSYGVSSQNHLLLTIRKLKESYPNICLYVDVALDPFTSHGHDGLVSTKEEVLNDETVIELSKMSTLYADAGADVIAPSDMMDGRVGFIRKELDKRGFQNTNILAYSAKYASVFYGPFREALGSQLTKGNKKSYQLNPANSKEALLEAKLDEEEGADFLMIKPATLYLDIIQKIKNASSLPIVAYHVSGEYSMLKAAAQKGWINFDQALYESLISIKRAGADAIITYAAKEILTLLKNQTF